MALLKHPGLYADLGKKSSDLLNKEFPDRYKVEVKTKTLSGVNFEGNVTRNPDGSIFGSFYPKYRFGQGITVGAQIDTKRAVKVELSAEDVVPGLKATITGHGDSESVTLEGEYKHEYVTLAGSVNLLAAQGNRLTAASVFGYDGFALGLQAEYVYDKWRTINGVASYTSPDFVATVFARANTQTSTNILGLTYHQRFNIRTAIAAEASIDVSKTTESPKIAIGGSYDLDLDTTVKGRLDTEGRVSLSYAQRLNRYTRAIFGTSINTNNFGASGIHTVGMTLSFND